MRKTLTTSVFAIAGLLCGIAAAQQPATAPAKDGQSYLPEGEPAFTELQAQAWTLELVPLVETAAGRKFKTQPRVVITDRKGLAEAIKKDLLVTIGLQNSSLSESDRDRQAQSMADTTAKMFMGLYCFSDEKLFLLPKNILPLLKACKVDEKHTESISRIVLAHELAHALQDQQISLKKCMSCLSGPDAMQAFLAVTEGHAMLVQDSVAETLKLDDSARQMASMLAAGAVKFDDPALALVNKAVADQYEQIYLGGRKFMEHFAPEGKEKLWSIIENPPTATSMISDPATYSSAPTGKVDLAEVLAGVEKLLDGKWVIQNVEIGRIALSGLYAGMEEEKRKEAVGLARQVQGLIASGKADNAGRTFSVSVYILNDSRACKTLVNMVEAMVRDNVEKIKSSEQVKVQDLNIEDCRAIKGDICRQTAFTLVDAKTGQKNSIRGLRICRGDCMIELFCQDVPMDDAKLSEMIEDVFRKLDAVRTMPATKPATKASVDLKPLVPE